METSDILRHQIIKSLLAHHTAKGGDGAILVWEQMAKQLVSLIGEDGFAMLYTRSVVLTQPAFPWLSASAQLLSASNRFVELNSSFNGQSPTNAHAANSQLLIAFTDIVASLIGEELTINTLRSAWGHIVVKQQNKGKKNG